MKVWFFSRFVSMQLKMIYVAPYVLQSFILLPSVFYFSPIPFLLFKGHQVVIKRLNKTTVHRNREMLLEFKMV